VSHFVVTIDKSEYATYTATWRFRFAKPEPVVSLPCPLTSNSMLQPRAMTCHPAVGHMLQVTFAALLVHLILPINLSGDYGNENFASEIDSDKIGMLAAFSNCSDLASNL
jgi:hypothetical protein